MRAVFMGPMPRVASAADYLINRARRGNLPPVLTLQMAGALCVADDSGDDPDRAREATTMLYSLKAGGLLESTGHGGDERVSPAALRSVASQLEAKLFFGEAARLWAEVPTQIARDGSDYQVGREAAILELEKMGYQSASVILNHPGRYPWLSESEGASPGYRWWLSLVAAFKSNAAKSQVSGTGAHHDQTTTPNGKILKVRGV